MTRALLTALVVLSCTKTWGQYPIYPAFPQPPAVSAYMPYQPFYQGQYSIAFSPFGYRGFGFGARGYYRPNPYGNMNWLPPNPPSPYYVVPSGREYLDQAERRDRANYDEILLRHALKSQH